MTTPFTSVTQSGRCNFRSLLIGYAREGKQALRAQQPVA